MEESGCHFSAGCTQARMKTSRHKFWETLKASKGEWFITHDGAIRREGSTAPFFHCCPVCHVANIILGLAEYCSAAFSAGDRIGLHRDFVADVMSAADKKRPTSGRTQLLRQKLIHLLQPTEATCP